jgi:uncharacterized protein
MGRILFFLLLAIAAYVGWRWVRSQRLRDSREQQRGSGDRPAEAMVSCATCGLHLPRREALVLGERHFCCEDHRRSAPPQ